MHCRECGAPSYQDPCPTCNGRLRTQMEQGLPTLHATAPAQPSSAPQVPLIPYPVEQMRALLHHVWTKNIGGHEYVRAEWEMMESGLAALYRQIGIVWNMIPPPDAPVAEPEPPPAVVAPAVVVVPPLPETASEAAAGE